LIVCGLLFICAQSAIRATGRGPRKVDRRISTHPPKSADAGAWLLRAARANRIFRTDERRRCKKCGSGYKNIRKSTAKLFHVEHRLTVRGKTA